MCFSCCAFGLSVLSVGVSGPFAVVVVSPVIGVGDNLDGFLSGIGGGRTWYSRFLASLAT